MTADIPYTLIRSRRKSFAIIVGNDAGVTVRAPLRATHAQVQAVLASKARWIRERQEQVRQAASAHPPRRFSEGELFPFLGVDYPLAILERASPLLHLDGRFELARQAQSRAPQVFESWYKEQARRYFNQRLLHFAKLHRLGFRRLRLSNARTRWGSCSSLGDINLVWRLVMAPPEIIDYVIVHELAHRVERNHSSRYWKQVETMMPDYRSRRLWLKKNGQSLVWD
jgi:hypothetical protein